MIHTRLCDLLGIDHPILNAPMGGTAVAALAAAVSNAGGFGMIGGTSRGGPDWLRAQIRAARAQTDRPFGVGFISSFPDVDDLVQVALDEQVAVINHSFADPTPYVAAAKARGVRTFAQVQSLARRNVPPKREWMPSLPREPKLAGTRVSRVRFRWCQRSWIAWATFPWWRQVALLMAEDWQRR